MFSLIHVIGVLSLVFILTVQSTHNVFTYDDGEDERCCMVQLGDHFCLAKPLTRSLIQVNKDCQRLAADDKTKNYLSKVVHRLNVETSHKVGDKILVELQKPLDKEILKNDLLCLAATNNNIDLEKCYVVLADAPQKKQKRKGKNETTEEPVAEEPSDEKNTIRQVEIAEPVRIHQGHGLAVHESYELNLTDDEPTTRQQRESWAWYRTNTKKMCSQPLKHKKTCISLNDQNEKYLEHILDDKQTSDDEQQSQRIISITKGSKLYCESRNQHTKLLGYYLESEVCFLTNNRLYVEHKFTDFVSLSDRKKNEDILRFISNNTKLTNEFEHDCNDKTTLADVKKALEKEAEAEAVENDETSAT